MWCENRNGVYKIITMVIKVKDKSGNVVRIIKTEDYKNTVVIGKTVIHSSPQPVSNEDLQNILKSGIRVHYA